MKKKVEDLSSILLFPLLFLLIVLSVVLIFGDVLIKEGLIGTFGGALVGVILGFIAEMFRDEIKEFQRKTRNREIYLKLLEKDAKDAHRNIWLYTGLINHPQTPQEVKSQLPAEFDLRYWKQLSKEKDFLSFGSEIPFNKVFDIMWNLEKINFEIQEAKNGNRQAYQFAMVFYQTTIEVKETTNLLLNFMDQDEINNLEASWLKTAQERKK